MKTQDRLTDIEGRLDALEAVTALLLRRLAHTGLIDTAPMPQELRELITEHPQPGRNEALVRWDVIVENIRKALPERLRNPPRGPQDDAR